MSPLRSTCDQIRCLLGTVWWLAWPAVICELVSFAFWPWPQESIGGGQPAVSDLDMFGNLSCSMVFAYKSEAWAWPLECFG